MTEDEMKPFVIVAIVHSVNDRQYATEADAIEDAMELAEQTGHSYKVVKVCGRLFATRRRNGGVRNDSHTAVA